MTKRFSKILSAFLAVLMVMSILPVSVFAACSHSYTKVYTMENANMHSYKSKCTKCGTVTEGWGYSGWLDHTFNSNGKCTACGYCKHSNTKTVYSYENANMHSYYATCNGCGSKLDGYGYAGWSNHSFNGNTCSQCKYTKSCSHSDSRTVYTDYSTSQHKVASKCRDCGITYNTTTESHSWDYGDWESISSSKHERTKSCVCGRSTTESASHSFSGNICSGCGYRKETTPAVTASVSLSASSSSGSLGSSGGEISSESVPASYTVTTSASGCSVTKISYVKDGTVYTSYGSSVTITANSEKDFTTTTFTAYTNVSGVTATFTVNHKYVRKNTSAVMWRTSHEATIRSITGNGLNKTLSYTMTIPNSYDSQTNLTADQIATIQGLIGRSDGKTYTVNYTRVIEVYTPAVYSSTGRDVVLGTFDGNSSSDIAECLSTWGWNSSTKEAIRQAASSSLTFTTGLPVDCTAIWIDTSTGKQLYSKAFGSGSVNKSQSVIVSVSYSEYADSGKYVYESLAYSGDSTGTSTSQSYSQTYKSTSKPLTVTFYCHPQVTTGSITVKAIDGDTLELIPDADITCGGKTAPSNPYTFLNVKLGTYTASASADGYSSATGSATITSTDNSKTITLKLYKQAGDITVTVKDSETRQPIFGASVTGAGCGGTTNQNGVVSFEGIEFGTHTFTASADGYYSNTGKATISRTSYSTSITIYLDPIPKTGDITVTVLDNSTYNPIYGATVSGGGSSKTTNSSGKAYFYDVLYGGYTFTASASGYYSGSGYASISDSYPTDSVTIYLDPIPTSGDITVRVVDSETDKAIYGANVSGANRNGTTNSSGYVYFYDVSFGSYTFTASASGYYSNSKTASISQNDPTDSITIYLDPIPTSGDITVYVKDKETGSAIFDAYVSGSGRSGSTNSSGKIKFTGLNFGTHTFTATASEYDSGSGSGYISESDTEDTVTIYLEKSKTDLSPDAFCNGDIYKGSTIIVSAEITNEGDVDLTPSKSANVTMTAKRNGSTVFDTQSKTVIIPANDSNLVWFTVDMPASGYTSDTVTFAFEVTAPAGVTEINLYNNDDTLTKTVYDLPNRDCEDPGMTTDAPSSFKYSKYSEDTSEILEWEVYEWDGGFVKQTYTTVLDMTASLIPNENAGYREKISGIWTTRSGYGVDTEVSVDVDSDFEDLEGTLKVDTFYPEHNYSTAVKKSDRLELVSENYVFKKNSSSVNASRMHGIPLWFPDGAYSVKYYAYDLWCPAGMLTGYTNAFVNITGDMYDDLYTN